MCKQIDLEAKYKANATCLVVCYMSKDRNILKLVLNSLTCHSSDSFFIQIHATDFNFTKSSRFLNLRTNFEAIRLYQWAFIV